LSLPSEAATTSIRDRMSGFQKILRHRHSHIAEPEERDSRH